MNMVNLINTPKRSRVSTPVRDNIYSQKKSKFEDSRKSAVEKLLEKLPDVDRYFTVHKKIGEGTFSNVFMATSRLLPIEKKFAIKHLTPTCHPSRIIQEMKCLKDIGGRDNVVGLELCFRKNEAVAFVMPYFQHDSFSQYVTEMTPRETQLYMKNLLIALQRVHSFDIIHRDVKPSNFLYNRKEQKFLLVDFGLSHKVDNLSKNSSNSITCIKTGRKRLLGSSDKEVYSVEAKRPVLLSLSNNVLGKSDRQTLMSSQKKKSPLFKENSPISKQLILNRNINQVKRNLQFGTITPEVKKEMPLLNEKQSQPFIREQRTFTFNKVAGSSFFRVQNSQIKSQFLIGGHDPNAFRKPTLMKECGCDKKPRICNSCITRKSMHAPRAGTPGYRSPEVLLKYPHQTTAVDIWSAGVIMLSILSGSYPFFRAPDDITALMEMITIFGTDELKNTATKLGRNLLCNEIRKPLKLNKLCERLRRRSSTDDHIENEPNMAICDSCFQKIFPKEGCLCSDNITDNNMNEECGVKTIKSQIFPKEAYDLMSKLLCIDPEKRYTAEAALRHPFFQIDLPEDGVC